MVHNDVKDYRDSSFPLCQLETTAASLCLDSCYVPSNVQLSILLVTRQWVSVVSVVIRPVCF